MSGPKSILNETVMVTLQGRQQPRSLVAAIVLKQCEEALRGSHRSAESISEKAKDFGILEKPLEWDENVQNVLLAADD